MMHAGHPQKQALAAAYRTQRESRANGGVAGMASGGSTNFATWYVRQEARGMHEGPILGSIPGRTDHMPLKVASGSYILPAAHVSSMGQGNTNAGFATLGHMFGMGPYGSGKPMGMSRGMGMPKAPPLPKFGLGGMSDVGGARGEEGGEPVDIMAASGEFTIPPRIVKKIGKGDLKHGHAILDAWVMKRRKTEIKTLRKLPPPAKR